MANKIKDVENLEQLFSDNVQEAIKAINEKKDWINRKVLLPGNLYLSMGEDNKEHYSFLEDMLNKVISFEKPYYSSLILSKEHVNNINKSLEIFNICVFKTKINMDEDIPFYLEFDLSKIDDIVYRELMPNFFFMHPEEELNILFDKDFNKSTLDAIKVCLIGNKDDVCLVLDNDRLLHSKYYLPVISKIYVTRKIPDEIINELLLFAKTNNITIEVLYENKKTN